MLKKNTLSSVGESYFCITILRYSMKNLLIALFSYFLCKVMHYVTFALLFVTWAELA